MNLDLFQLDCGETLGFYLNLLTLRIERKPNWFSFCLLGYAPKMYFETRNLFGVSFGQDISRPDGYPTIYIDLFYMQFSKTWKKNYTI